MRGDVAVALAPVFELFAADAEAVDRTGVLPREHLDALAAIGLYGAVAPRDEGGWSLDLGELAEVVEELAAACLASAFIWIQHFRLLEAALDERSGAVVRSRRAEIVAGHLKGGISLTGLQPGPARLTATPTSEGWSLRGASPWVSGWGLVDVLYVAARTTSNDVVHLVLAPEDQRGLSVTPYDLVALDATRTVRLDYDDVAVPSERVIAVTPYAGGVGPPEGLRVNGALALGVARRCTRLIGDSGLDDELTRCRDALARADATQIAAARAGACELAVRAAHALAVYRGSPSVLRGDVAERTAREASLLLNFGSRPAIREALLRVFGAAD